MHKNQVPYSLAAIILFIAVILAVSSHGRHNRIFAPEPTTHTIESAKQAYQIWQGQKIKGRILLLFDNYPHFVGRINYSGKPELTGSNFVELAIFSNMVRKVFLIIPDSKWVEFRKQDAKTNPIREYTDAEVGVYLFNLNGTPLIALPLSQLPELAEKPLVYINSAVFDYSPTLSLLSQKKTNSDCIISLQENGR